MCDIYDTFRDGLLVGFLMYIQRAFPTLMCFVRIRGSVSLGWRANLWSFCGNFSFEMLSLHESTSIYESAFFILS